MRATLSRTQGLGGGLTLLILSSAVMACSPSSKPVAHPPSTVAPTPGLTAQHLSPAWTHQGEWQPPGPAQRRQLYACLARPAPALISQSASSTFKGPGGVVAFSVTDVFPSAAAAASDVALRRSSSFAGCAAGLATALFAVLPPGATFGALTVEARPFPPAGDGAVAQRFTMSVTEGHKSATATADAVSVLTGATELTVSFIGTTDPSSAVSEAQVVHGLVTTH